MQTFNSSSKNHNVNVSVWDQYYTTCVPYKRQNNSRGIWFGDDPTYQNFPIFMLQIIMMFFFSRLIYFILKPLKQPKFNCNLLAGIILGPSVMGQKKAFLHRVLQPAQLLFTNLLFIIGVMYFIFLSGVKIDKCRIVTTSTKSMKVGLICFMVPTLIFMFLFYVFPNFNAGTKNRELPLYVSSHLSLSYFPVISDALIELNLLTSELGKIAMSCTILHEVLAWIFLSLSVILRGNLREMVQSASTIILLTFFIMLVFRPMVQWIIRRTPEGKPVDCFYIKAILVGPLIIGVLSDIIGISVLPGALIMGLIIPSGPPLGSSVVYRSELVISEFILPFMYIRAGQLMNVHSITDWKMFATGQFIMFSGYLAKMAGCLLALPCSNGGLLNSFFLGLILNTKGAIDLTLLLRWRTREFIDQPSFTAIMISNMVVTAIVTPLLKIFYKPHARHQASTSSKNCARTLQSTLFRGEFRIMCCVHGEENVHGLISFLKACISKQTTPTCVYAVHLINLEGRAAPLLQPYNSQRKRFKMTVTDRIMKALSKSLIKDSSIIQPFRVIAPYNTMHESICQLALDKFIPFILVPFPESLDTHGRKTTLRGFNINMQMYAPCTVGILVDRSLPRIFSSNCFTYNVGVIFIGGPDDREALMLVSCMAGNPGVNINVLRIILKAEKDKNTREKYIDECLIREFRAKNIGNDRVVWKEVVAENTMEALDFIRKPEKNYDLVIVGERKGANSQLERELLPWVENKELGVIGDMVASSDFCGGMVSILVMHCVNIVTSSMTISDDTSPFSFFSSDGDMDHKGENVLLGDKKTHVNICRLV